MHVTDEHLEHLIEEFGDKVVYCTKDKPYNDDDYPDGGMFTIHEDAVDGNCPHCGYEYEEEDS